MVGTPNVPAFRLIVLGLRSRRWEYKDRMSGANNDVHALVKETQQQADREAAASFGMREWLGSQVRRKIPRKHLMCTCRPHMHTEILRRSSYLISRSKSSMCAILEDPVPICIVHCSSLSLRCSFEYTSRIGSNSTSFAGVSPGSSRQLRAFKSSNAPRALT